jgi:membrane protein DedA with SNARE-associated domain
MNPNTIAISPGPRMRTALLLAIIADTLQIVFSPLFFEGAASPADDILDLCMAGVLSYLLGWHCELLPSFLAKLVPGWIWFLSGRWLLRTSTGDRSGSRSPWKDV